MCNEPKDGVRESLNTAQRGKRKRAMQPPIQWFLVQFILPQWKLGLGLLSEMLFTTALAFPVPLFFRLIIDELIPEGRFGELTWVGLGLVFVVVLRGLFACLEQYLTVVAEETLVADVENAMVRHLLTLPSAFFQEREVGYLMARVRSDPTVAKAFSLGFLNLLNNAVFLGMGAGLLFWLDWQLALVAAAVLPALAFGSRTFNRRLQTLSQQIQEGDALVSKELGEGLASALTTKLLELSTWVEGKIARAIARLKEANVQTNTAGAMAGGCSPSSLR